MIRAARQWLYQGKILPVVELPAFVISVGNLSMGGTGKSPFAIWLCERALRAEISTALLTRGYKRKSKRLEILGPNAPLPDADDLGDEPWMIKNRVPGISLLVHPDRARMAKRHWQELGAPKLVVLDDAFQHWRAARDRDVVMIDAGESLSQGTFPFGRLRESKEALQRADLVVITRSGAISQDALFALEQEIRGLAEPKKTFPWKRSRGKRVLVAAADYDFSHFFLASTGEQTEIPKEKKIILASGIAKPDGFRMLAKKLELPVVEEIYFPDHHRLTSSELEKIKASIRAQGDAALVITEKDWARWKESLHGIAAYGMKVEFRFSEKSEEPLSEFFREVKCSISP